MEPYFLICANELSSITRRKDYATLLEDQNVDRWYKNMVRGSQATADVYLRRLGNFCKNYKLKPESLIGKDQDEIYNLLLDLVSSMEEDKEKDYSGGYIHSIIKAIKSWLSHNKIEITRSIKIKGTQETPTLHEERVPTSAELKKILLSGDKKTRATCLLVAHSGLRIMSIGHYSGNDGLKIKDFPELNIQDCEVVFEKVPTQLIVRRNLSEASSISYIFERGRV
jgi:hypothetical protein